MVLVVLPEGRILLILNVRPTHFLCSAGIAIELDPHGIQARQNLTIRSEIGTGREPDHLCGAEADPCRGDSQCGRTENTFQGRMLRTGLCGGALWMVARNRSRRP